VRAYTIGNMIVMSGMLVGGMSKDSPSANASISAGSAGTMPSAGSVARLLRASAEGQINRLDSLHGITLVKPGHSAGAESLGELIARSTWAAAAADGAAIDGAAVADTGTSADSSTGSPHTDMGNVHTLGNVLDVDFVTIVGMPRSGTSVLAQMLSMHPSVVCVGEHTALSTIGEALVHTATEMMPLKAKSMPSQSTSGSTTQATMFSAVLARLLASATPMIQIGIRMPRGTGTTNNAGAGTTNNAGAGTTNNADNTARVKRYSSLLDELREYFRREIAAAAVYALEEKRSAAGAEEAEVPSAAGAGGIEAPGIGRRGSRRRRRLVMVSQNGMDLVHLWLLPLLLDSTDDVSISSNATSSPAASNATSIAAKLKCASVRITPRVVHIRRNVNDTALSIYFQLFEHTAAAAAAAATATSPAAHTGTIPLAWAYNLTDIRRMSAGFDSLMDYWLSESAGVLRVAGGGSGSANDADGTTLPLHAIQYEALVRSPRVVVGDLIHFLGISWHEDCLKIDRSRRVVHTASNQQVQSPLYSSSVGRWGLYTAGEGSHFEDQGYLTAKPARAASEHARAASEPARAAELVRAASEPARAAELV
jgi:hypothetical protein